MADINTTYGIKYNGNIDLNSRPIIRNKDGSVSTEKSIGVSRGDGTEYLIPTAIKGQIVSASKARNHFHKTGQHLGTRVTPKDDKGWMDWKKYAKDISKRQEQFYKENKSGLGLSKKTMQDVKK